MRIPATQVVRVCFITKEAPMLLTGSVRAGDVARIAQAARTDDWDRDTVAYEHRVRCHAAGDATRIRAVPPLLRPHPEDKHWNRKDSFENITENMGGKGSWCVPLSMRTTRLCL